jgi:hypothetical protein
MLNLRVDVLLAHGGEIQDALQAHDLNPVGDVLCAQTPWFGTGDSPDKLLPALLPPKRTIFRVSPDMRPENLHDGLECGHGDLNQDGEHGAVELVVAIVRVTTHQILEVRSLAC